MSFLMCSYVFYSHISHTFAHFILLHAFFSFKYLINYLINIVFQHFSMVWVGPEICRQSKPEHLEETYAHMQRTWTRHRKALCLVEDQTQDLLIVRQECLTLPPYCFSMLHWAKLYNVMGHNKRCSKQSIYQSKPNTNEN